MNRVLKQIQEFSTNREDADFLPNVLGGHVHEAATGNIPVVLFGAGSAGVHLCKALKILNVAVDCFCDNNARLVGGLCAGHPVISVEELGKNHRGSLIVISASRPYAGQIGEQLPQLGFAPDRLHTPPPDPLLYYTNAANLYWPPEDLEAHAEQLQAAYDLFSDAKSKELFVQRLALLSGGFDYASFRRFIQRFADLTADPAPEFFANPRYDENHYYFHSDFFPLQDGEVFANVGALVGDCAVEFADACTSKGLRYKEIINFEPDPENFLQLSANMDRVPRVRCLPYGLWSGRTRLRFSNPEPSRPGTPGSLDDDGNLDVEVAALDELLPDSEISFIKMDVEGAEIEALRGAAGTLRRNAPKLAISVYHKREDVFEIPLFVHRIHPGYKLYLRHHSTTFGETVLYAVP